MIEKEAIEGHRPVGKTEDFNEWGVLSTLLREINERECWCQMVEQKIGSLEETERQWRVFTLQ